LANRNGNAHVTGIITKTREAVEKSHAAIAGVAGNARREVIWLRQEIPSLQADAKLLDNENDRLELELGQAMLLLSAFAGTPAKHAMEDLESAFASVEAIRISMAVNREREKQGIARRIDLELRLRNAIDTVNMAEQASLQTVAALGFLSTELAAVGEQMESADNKRLLAMNVIQAHEEERRSISREIHDGPAQAMSNVVLKAEIIEKLFDVDITKTRAELANLKTITRNSLQDVRRIIYDLRPMSLDDLGLRPTLIKYVASFMKEYGIKTEVAFAGDEHRLANKTIILAVFRTIQECLSNIRKHAQASSVSVSVEFSPSAVMVRICDDGVGFDATRVSQAHLKADGGFGLFGMRERIEMLDGAMEYDTAPGKGTTVRITLPYEAKEG
jgi:two-component system sensor histidine kinase DegS